MRPEHYRPTTWEGIVGQPTSEVREKLDGAQTPNYLLYGPPGNGKTTTAYMAARHLHGDTSELMEVNSSDDRKLETVRDEIAPAANQTTLSGLPRIILLDEFDKMTPDAQAALKKPMERGNAIFVLACNDVTAVDDAIKSRCVPVEYGPLTPDAIAKRVSMLNDQHDLGLTDGQITRIASNANGDMRRAIHQLDDPPEPSPADSTGGNLEKEAQAFINGED